VTEALLGVYFDERVTGSRGYGGFSDKDCRMRDRRFKGKNFQHRSMETVAI